MADPVIRSSHSIEIVLRPMVPNEFAVQASLVLASELFDLLELSYLDDADNRTVFSITDYSSGLEHGTFNPPEDVAWVEH